MREEDELPVVLKMLTLEDPSRRDLIRFRQEFKILSALKDISSVIRAHDLIESGPSLALVLEDFGGARIDQLYPSVAIPLAELLPLAIQIASTLGEIHAANVIHKDVNPSNILVDPATGQIKLIDFNLSTLMSRENPPLSHPSGLEGTLPYISPEQTGRMNRAVDYRTDLYSLGATLYELLVGKTMFSTETVLELVHCHIAKLPHAPHEVDDQIPRVISEIVMKLLSKTPERRYQSAFGVKADLEDCLEQLRTNGRIISFAIGQRDISGGLNIPQKLYGREQEQQRLLEGFERVASQGGREVMMISGPPGIGKTSLVHEVHKPMTQHQAIYISGKFEQLQRHTPYFGLIAACRQLTRYLLSDKEDQLQRWREELLQAVSPNGKVLTDFVPDLELLLGPQPDVPVLAPSESQNRFFHVVQKFFAVFARKDHPLVLFLDDLQWADAASLKLLSILLCASEGFCLYFMGAYRDNEVTDSHPMVLTLRELPVDVPIYSVQLKPLYLKQVTQLLADTFHRPASEVLPLAEQAHTKTRGNPFFVNEFLESLFAERLIFFQAFENRWDWDQDGISKRGFTENVIDLLTEKIGRMDEACRHSLSTAACVGQRFSLELLACFLEQPPKRVLDLLYPLLQSGLLFPIGDAYQNIEHDAATAEDLQRVELRFAHDRIHAAAYSLSPEPVRLTIHKKLGEMLLQRHPPEEGDGWLFDIVNHLNVALPLVTATDERLQLARLNLLAGKKAKLTAAYEQSVRYLLCARELLGPEGWAEDHALTLEVTTESAEAAFLSTDLERLWQLSAEAIEHARTPMEKVKPHLVMVWGHLAQNHPVQGIQVALTLLRLLGMKYPENPSKVQVLLSLLSVKRLIRRRSVESLLELPPMSAPAVEAAIQTMRSMAAALFQANPKLHVYMLCKQLDFLFRYGNNHWSGSICTSCGIVFCGLLDDLNTGYRMGKVALELSERFPSAAHKARTMYLYNCFEGHVQDSLESTLKSLQEGYQVGLQTGDLEYAAFNAHVYCEHAFCQGKDLSGLEQEMAAYTASVRRLKQEKLVRYNEAFWQAVTNLQGRSEDPCMLIGECFNEHDVVPRSQALNDLSGLFGFHWLKCLLYLLFDQPQEALRSTELCREHLASTRGMFIFTRFFAYDSLARLSVHADATARDRRRNGKLVAANQKKLKKRADFAPMNHLHLYLLVEAERRRISGRLLEAQRLYDSAIEEATRNRFINDLALIQERAGLFYLQQGRHLIAKSYLTEARLSYLKWGAVAKVQQMEKTYPDLLVRKTPSLVKSSGSASTSTSKTLLTRNLTFTTTPTSSSSQTGTTSLDFESVIKATQSISSQIVLADLLDNLLRTVLENAGAEKGALVFEREGRLWIEAWLKAEQDPKVRVESSALERRGELCSAIVRYVFRTRASVVLGDAANEGGFVQDSYVLEHRPKSILCIPIQRQNRVVGVLYLENNQVTDAFTPDRIQVLDVLATQAAISIENAKLYDELSRALMETKESERIKTEFLARTSHELRTPLNPIINIPKGILETFETQNCIHCKACGTLFSFEPTEQIDSTTRCAHCGATGALEIIAKRLCGEDPDTLYKFMELIAKSGESLLGIVNDILDVSNMEVGRVRLRKEQVRIREALKDALSSVEAVARQRDIRLEAPDLCTELTLVADRYRLTQILVSLLNNAV